MTNLSVFRFTYPKNHAITINRWRIYQFTTLSTCEPRLSMTIGQNWQTHFIFHDFLQPSFINFKLGVDTWYVLKYKEGNNRPSPDNHYKHETQKAGINTILKPTRFQANKKGGYQSRNKNVSWCGHAPKV